jgi:hypothetical protein
VRVAIGVRPSMFAPNSKVYLYRRKSASRDSDPGTKNKPKCCDSVFLMFIRYFLLLDKLGMKFELVQNLSGALRLEWDSSFFLSFFRDDPKIHILKACASPAGDPTAALASHTVRCC